MSPNCHFLIHDLFWDRDFRAWVLSPTQENSTIWNDKLASDPEQANSIRMAQEIVLALHCRGPTITECEVKQQVQETIDRIT